VLVPGSGEVNMTEDHSELAIEIEADPDTDDQELAELTSRLRAELLELDVEAVEPATAGQPPADAKGIELLAIGALIVRLALRRDVLHGIVSGVRSWANRQHASSVKLTLDGDILELTGPRSADQERLVDLWIARHADPG
jgi:hypothetical protein